MDAPRERTVPALVPLQNAHNLLLLNTGYPASSLCGTVRDGVRVLL
jgi:hypothetical protein